jgi:orotidine-5'-phosphate decarboxylase
MNFKQKLNAIAYKNKSWLCVGLDPHFEKLPVGFDATPKSIKRFCCQIIEATKDLTCCYKPNFAFYLALGVDGVSILRDIVSYISKDIPVILDAKFGDIGNTAERYAQFAFDYIKADAVTVNPLLGFDAVKPFIDYKDKYSFMLCLTSNKSSQDIQKLTTSDNKLIYHHLANLSLKWSENDNIGLVVGATHPDELTQIRAIVPDQVFLIPGIGAQGGDLEATLKAAFPNKSSMAIINSSRGIIHASQGKDFIEAARKAAQDIIQPMQPYF